MNIYDFDETIYDSDSTKDFYFYCLKKYPKILLSDADYGMDILFVHFGS